MPLRFMSRTRSWTSYTPGRISAKPAGSRPHSSAGQDTTALSPLTPCGLPWYIHWSTPLSSVTTIGASSLYLAGTWLRNMSGGSTTWSSMLTRIRSSMFMTHPRRRGPLGLLSSTLYRRDRLCAFGQRFGRTGQHRPSATDRPAPRRPRPGRQLSVRGRGAGHRLALPRRAPDRVRDRRRGRGGDRRRRTTCCRRSRRRGSLPAWSTRRR